METFEHLSRRGFIRLAAGTSVAGAALALLSACGGAAAPAAASASSPASSPAAASAAGSAKPAASGSVAASAAGSGGGSAAPKPSGNAQAYPKYMPLANKPKPDFPSTGFQYE